MRLINRSTVNCLEVFDACVAGVPDVNLRARLNAARNEVAVKWRAYEQHAGAHTLHLSSASAWGKSEHIVLGNVTKGEFKSLYEDHMAKGGCAGRGYYDAQMLLAPSGICPYCRIGHVKTLDHFLAKARYPVFSTLLHNLVPSCRDCNSPKHGGVISAATEMSHPFFEDRNIETEAWLYADVLQTAPTTLQYRVSPPATWPVERARRVKNYFKDFDLAGRFGVQAAAAVIEVADHLEIIPIAVDRHLHLSRNAMVERDRRKNTWKAAMYEALAGSPWYYEGGFRLP